MRNLYYPRRDENDEIFPDDEMTAIPRGDQKLRELDAEEATDYSSTYDIPSSVLTKNYRPKQ